MIRPRFPAFVAAALLASSLVASVGVSSSTASSTLASLRSEASILAARIDTAQTKLDILSEQFDQASRAAGGLQHAVAADRSALARAQATVDHDHDRLRQQAVDAYVGSGAVTGLGNGLTSTDAGGAQQTYMAVASSGLDTAISTLRYSEHQLTIRQATLDAALDASLATTRELDTARSSAADLEANLTSTLAGVKGHLAQLVAAQEQQQAAQQAAAAAAAPVAAQAAREQPANTAAAPATSTVVSSSGSGSAPGAAALAAAESQLGTPYEWGGASPGGYDCSGLVMWAWAHAGVDLPHSAAAQYATVQHISFSQLQPGDLIFYASGGYVYHVIMYAGGNRAIQAINFGTVVSYTPVWPGAIGAGRP